MIRTSLAAIASALLFTSCFPSMVNRPPAVNERPSDVANNSQGNRFGANGTNSTLNNGGQTAPGGASSNTAQNTGTGQAVDNQANNGGFTGGGQQASNGNNNSAANVTDIPDPGNSNTQNTTTTAEPQKERRTAEFYPGRTDLIVNPYDPDGRPIRIRNLDGGKADIPGGTALYNGSNTDQLIIVPKQP